MKYYLIAGEKSGDLHAANLIKAIQKKDPNAQFRAFGGDKMQAAGAEIVQHYDQMAFMGFLEVLKNFWLIRSFLKKCKQDILSFQPDVVILVDYAGFNMRIAHFAKKNSIKTFYYISPKIWAWNQSRAKKIRRDVDKMFVILPFEKEFYKKFAYQVDYVGNPIFDEIANFSPNPHFFEQHQIRKPIVAVLAGSRRAEIKYMLPEMIKVARHFEDYEFVIAAVNNMPESEYALAKEAGFKIIYEQTYDLLAVSRAALVTSGTATLETALFEVPQIVCYKLENWQYQLGKMLIKVPFISLVNLIAGKEVVKELIQNQLHTANLVKELKAILNEKRPRILGDYKQLKEQIRTESASKTAADLMWKYLNE